ncbi:MULTISPECIES: ATPase [Microbacterium]|uniref:ATPase n=1 Tax=Microbacterium TaxID=33882 RepID=UPI0019C1137E|nr:MULTISPECIES: ATPase [Microbacterium]MBD3756821.1 ATPase [Microbacterium sp.]MCG7415206.1 ATPase [Microbacterium aurum]
MKSVVWFVLGLAGGFVAAHLVNKDPRGHEVLAEVDARITEFTDRIGEAYRAQEAKIDGIAADVKDAAAGAFDAAKDAAADAVEAAKDTAAKLAD